MQVDDILDIKFAIDYAGVSSVMGTYWKVNAYRGPSTDESILTMFATAFWDTFRAQITDAATLSCVKMVNKTTPGLAVILPNLPGANLDDGHPPHQAVRVYQYGRESFGEPAIRNSMNLTAVVESLSTRGRINDTTGFQALVDFLVNLWVGGATDADLRPMVKRTLTLGGVGQPDTVDYYPAEFSRLHEKLTTIRSRKYRLCI